MNWIKHYHRIPERVRLGIGGIVIAIAAVTAPTVIGWWCVFWS